MRRNKLILFLLAICCCTMLSAQQLTLDSCLRLAQENNASIRKAQLEVERARQVRMQALTKFFPQVQGTAVGFHSLEPIVELKLDDIAHAGIRELLLLLYGNYGESLGLENNMTLFQHGWTAGLTAVQPVFMGGKIVAGNKLAKLGVEAAELQMQITERDLLEEVEESYWLVIGLQDKQRTIEHVNMLLDTVHHVVGAAVNAGLAMETDLMEVEIRKAELAMQKIRLEQGLSLAYRALAQSIGLDNLQLSEPATWNLEPATWNQKPETSGSSSPEADLLALQTRAAELQHYMSIADALPKVVVGGNYSYSHTDANFTQNGLGGWNGALFAMVTVPITGWWEAGHKIKEQSIRLEEARLQQRDMNEKLALRTQQAYDQMCVAQMLVEEAEKAVDLAEKRCHLAEVGYRAGTVSISDLLAAETQLLKAENERTDARIAFRVHQRRYRDLTHA